MAIWIVPDNCQHCGRKSTKLRLAIWPLKELLNGNGAYLCKKCWKDMQKVLKRWMKEGK